MRYRKFTWALSAAVGALITTAAQAALIETDSFTTNGTTSLSPTYVVSTTDLINGTLPTASSGNFTVESTGGIPVLTDGAFPDPMTRDGSGPFQVGSFADGGGNGGNGGASLTYTLATSSKITEIDVYGGWQDSGRDQQLYDVLYSTTAAPNTFILLASVNFNPSPSPGGFPVATKVALTDGTGTLIPDVAKLQFNFGNPENNHTGYAEIDVFGTAVPEPSSLLLFGLSAVGLLAVARRRRAG